MKLETLPAHAAMTLAMTLALGPAPLLAQTTSDDPFPSADSTELGVSVETLDELRATVSDWVEAGDPVGAEVLVIKEGRTIFHETFGWKDREREVPMEKHSIARIRSMTKPFVGTSILMLREKGELALDDRVSKYIRAWDTDLCRDIRIEQLLTHTAGFKQPGYPGNLRSFANLRDLVDAIGAAGPQMTPGQQYNYSDADTATLGCIVAELSGMPVEDFIQKNLLDDGWRGRGEDGVGFELHRRGRGTPFVGAPSSASSSSAGATGHQSNLEAVDCARPWRDRNRLIERGWWR